MNNNNELLLKFSPILYFHNKEKYYPISINTLLKNSILVDHNNIPTTKISNPTNIDIYNLSEKYNFQNKPDGTINLSFDGKTLSDDKLNDVPCYGIIREFNNKIYITYIFVYGYNGSYPILGGIVETGQHTGDIEHITVELDDKKEINRIMYGAHGNIDGKWIHKKDLLFEDNKPVCYVALNGHGLYNDVGTMVRIYGFANDLTEKGKKWIPKVEEIFSKTNTLFTPETMGWTVFTGRIGGSDKVGDTSGISSLVNKNWYGVDAKYIDILEENKLKPPPVIENKELCCCNIL